MTSLRFSSPLRAPGQIKQGPEWKAVPNPAFLDAAVGSQSGEKTRVRGPRKRGRGKQNRAKIEKKKDKGEVNWLTD